MLDNDPLWYRDALIYELHVRAFHDSDGDGIGDFRGLTAKLDYLQDLGITAVWLVLSPEDGNRPFAEIALHPRVNRTGAHWHIVVHDLRSKIRSGSYYVSSTEIVDALLGRLAANLIAD